MKIKHSHHQSNHPSDQQTMIVVDVRQMMLTQFHHEQWTGLTILKGITRLDFGDYSFDFQLNVKEGPDGFETENSQ